MSFTRAQQPEFRTLLERAWTQACAFDRSLGERCPKSKRCGVCSFCKWYEDLLEAATGHRSTTKCDAGRDYEEVMKRLEGIIGDSIKWHIKAARGDANRIRHELLSLCEDHEIEDRYMRAIAQQSLKLDHAPELEEMTKDQLATVLIACKQHVTRKLVAERRRDPQVSRKTWNEKRPQVKAAREALEAELSMRAADTEEGDPF